MEINVRELGLCDYASVFADMQAFTQKRNKTTPDEIWLLEHHPVFTQGRHGKPEHVLNPGDIPVIQTDRGGQVTYHGPGQLVAYLLLDLNRRNIGPKQFVCAIETAIINVLKDYQIEARALKDNPGVYVDNKKIASLGLRLKKGLSYHGISLNVDMDLEPFSRINPCGMKALEITQLAAFSLNVSIDYVGNQFADTLVQQLTAVSSIS